MSRLSSKPNVVQRRLYSYRLIFMDSRGVISHNIKDNERNLCQDLLTIENTNSDLKVHVQGYANELLVRVTLSQKLLQSRLQICLTRLPVRITFVSLIFKSLW